MSDLERIRSEADQATVLRLQAEVKQQKRALFMAGKRVTDAEGEIRQLREILWEVQKTLTAYWTDIPEAEIQRLVSLTGEKSG